VSVLAIDPGNKESAIAWIGADLGPRYTDKVPNDQLCGWLRYLIDDANPRPTFAIEMVASYGMAVGADVFETCVWIGRFAETIDSRVMPHQHARLVYRRDVKLHFCGTARAKDANITQALIDRFAPGVPNKGKGSKANPGWFYGFHSDIWQAYALAVYVADTDKWFPT
jgi:hypothetical protein